MKKFCATPTKENSRGLKKYHGKFVSKKFNQGKSAKQFSVHKHEQVSPIKTGIEPSLVKVTGS